MTDPSRGKDAVAAEVPAALPGEPVATGATEQLPGAAVPPAEVRVQPSPGGLPAEERESPAHPGVPLAPPGIVPESDVRTHSPAAAFPPRERMPYEEHLGELPAGYGDGRLVCLIRDPSTLFVYWDLSAQHLEQAFGGLGSSRALLKLWALRGELLRQTDVHLEARGWYLRDLPPGSEFRVELWAAGERGARLLRSSRPVRLPPAAPSEVFEEVYATLPLGVRLPRDGYVSGGRPLDWKSGSAAPAWERRVATRLGPANRSGAGLPGSATSSGPVGGGGPGSGEDEEPP